MGLDLETELKSGKPSKLRRSVILILDGDNAGRRATDRIAAQLAGQCSLQVVAVPAGKQPDQLNGDEIRALLGASLRSETNR